MNLYLIKRLNYDDDTYDSAIVCCEGEEEASIMHPNGNGSIFENKSCSSWTDDPNNVTVELIGEAVPGLEKGVIIASFNAG